MTKKGFKHVDAFEGPATHNSDHPMEPTLSG